MHENSECGRCGKTVYHAEKMNGAGRMWHKGGCFTCKDCNRRLSSSTLAECKEEEEVYCKTCYGKTKGPKGYGYGAGAGTLSMDAGGGEYAINTGPLSTSEFLYLGGNRCPRCHGSVYSAEEVVAAGMSWHRGCFRCHTCKRSLDSKTCEENGLEIYCLACHRRQFGPKGCGFGGGAGTLTQSR